MAGRPKASEQVQGIESEMPDNWPNQCDGKIYVLFCAVLLSLTFLSLLPSAVHDTGRVRNWRPSFDPFPAVVVLAAGTTETHVLKIDELLNRLPKRDVYIAAEHWMERGHEYPVQIGLTKGETQKLISALKASGPVRTFQKDVPISAIMSAQLSGHGFEIPSATTARQTVSETEPRIWRWRVIPTEFGFHKLVARVSIVLPEADGNEHEYAVADHEVIVFVGPFGLLQWIGTVLDWLLRIILAAFLTSLVGSSNFRAWFFKNARRAFDNRGKRVMTETPIAGEDIDRREDFPLTVSPPAPLTSDANPTASRSEPNGTAASPDHK